MIIAILLGTLAIQWQLLMKLGSIEAHLAALEVRVELAIDREREPARRSP